VRHLCLERCGTRQLCALGAHELRATRPAGVG